MGIFIREFSKLWCNLVLSLKLILHLWIMMNCDSPLSLMLGEDSEWVESAWMKIEGSQSQILETRTLNLCRQGGATAKMSQSEELYSSFNAEVKKGSSGWSLALSEVSCWATWRVLGNNWRYKSQVSQSSCGAELTIITTGRICIYQHLAVTRVPYLRVGQ